jgi:hypothetical protein
MATGPLRSLSSLSTHPTLICWSFVRAVSPDESTVAPSAMIELYLREETGGGGGVDPCDSGDCGGSVGQGGQHGTLLAASEGAAISPLRCVDKVWPFSCSDRLRFRHTLHCVAQILHVTFSSVSRSINSHWAPPLPVLPLSTHLTSIRWSFVRVVSPDASAVAPSAMIEL